MNTTLDASPRRDEDSRMRARLFVNARRIRWLVAYLVAVFYDAVLVPLAIGA
jgi:hypothetical protein